MKRPYKVLGSVKSKATYVTLDPNHGDQFLCRNYFNKAVRDLVRLSKDHGGDAVIDVKSLVFYMNGQQDVFSSAQCSDDGATGEVLVQGIAVKWKKLAKNGK